MKQLKLMDHQNHHQNSPSHLAQQMTGGGGGGLLNQLEQYALNELNQYQQQLNLIEHLSEEDKRKFEKAQNSIGNLLEELTNEQNFFNYNLQPVAYNLTKNISDEIQNFCVQLVEKKRNQPRDLHNLPASGLALSLGDHQN